MVEFLGFESGPRSNFTTTPNVMYDYFLGVLSGNEFKALSYIVRHTWGYHKNEDAISLNQFLNGIVRKEDGSRIDGGVGMSKPTIINALDSLENKWGAILKTKRKDYRGGNMTNKYRLKYIEDIENGSNGETEEKTGNQKSTGC